MRCLFPSAVRLTMLPIALLGLVALPGVVLAQPSPAGTRASVGADDDAGAYLPMGGRSGAPAALVAGGTVAVNRASPNPASPSPASPSPASPNAVSQNRAVADTSTQTSSAADVPENERTSDYLRAAQGALATGRTAEAQQALEMAQTRVLDRSVPLGQTYNPSKNPTVLKISEALQALAGRDRATCMQLIQEAIGSAAAQGL